MVFVMLETIHTRSKKEPRLLLYKHDDPKTRFFLLHESIRGHLSTQKTKSEFGGKNGEILGECLVELNYYFRWNFLRFVHILGW